MQAGHPDAHFPASTTPQGAEQGRATYHLLQASTRMFAKGKPAWHRVIQSEVIRSLILAGGPDLSLCLTSTSDPILQQAPGSQAPLSTDMGGSICSLSNAHTAVLAPDGSLDLQTADRASAQSAPALVHQALVLAWSADWLPEDFGVCAADSSESDSDSAKSNVANSAGQNVEPAAAGLDKVLVIAILAAYKCWTPSWKPASLGSTQRDSVPDELQSVDMVGPQPHLQFWQ